jgi:hypothetical protein
MHKHPAGKRSLSVILVAACLLAAVPASPQSEEAPPADVTDAEEGSAQGKADARGNAIWFLPGLLLPGVGMILPWVFAPAVPSDKLIGKSDEFVAAYRTAYIHKKKLGNFLWSLAGTGTTAVVVGTVVIVAITEAAVSTATSCSEVIAGNCAGAMSDACSDAFSPTCSSPSIGCSSLGLLPPAAFATLPPP